MDISNLTIPPNLFYSKNPSETWKPRCLSKITPAQISKEVAKNKTTNSTKSARKRKKPIKFANTPQLGRIGKVRNAFVKKKLLKKSAVLKEKSTNNNNIVIIKPPTKQEEHQLQKEIEQKEEEIKKRWYAKENLAATKKRRKGSNFKFFKSKNAQESFEKESSEDEDGLVPEIRDFTPTSSADTSRVIQEKPENTSKLVVDPEDFEDDCEPEIDGTIIESLLQNLDDVDTEVESHVKHPEQSVFSLDSLIGTLEGTGGEEQEPQVKNSKPLKLKYMGIGNNQMQIDAGQKKFGIVECKECGFSYNVSFFLH